MVCCLVVRSQRRQTEESPVCDINDMERWRLERGLHALTPPSPLSSSPVSSPLLLLPSPFLSPFHLFHLVSSTSHIFHYTSTPPTPLVVPSIVSHSWLTLPPGYQSLTHVFHNAVCVSRADSEPRGDEEDGGRDWDQKNKTKTLEFCSGRNQFSSSLGQSVIRWLLLPCCSRLNH